MSQLSLFKGRRQRGLALLPPREFDTHVVIADICRRWLMPSWRFTHLPMGEQRHPATAMRLKRMGVTRGWPDFMFVGPRRTMFWLELKRKGGRLGDDQIDIAAHLAACGFAYLCTSNVNDAIQTLKDLGIVRAGIEVR